MVEEKVIGFSLLRPTVTEAGVTDNEQFNEPQYWS
jgi:hypothetical protein